MSFVRTSFAIALLSTSVAAAQQSPIFRYDTSHLRMAILGDADGDGTIDVAFGDAISSAPRVSVHRLLTGEFLYEVPGPSGTGRAIAALDDMDGDGLPDWVVGGTGPVTIYRGTDGAQIWSFLEPNTSAPIALADAGDVDGDGTRDVIIGYDRAYDFAAGTQSGAIWVYSGRTKVLVHRVFGPPGSFFGASVDGVGDVNGDGLADFVVGASREDSPMGVSGAGVVRLLSGADASELQVWSVDDSFSGFGVRVAGLGDVDGDGLPDVAAGGPTYDEAPDFDIGIVRVLSSATGAVLHELHGIEDDELSYVASAGDFDGDGHGDFTVSGDPTASPSVRVISGRTGAVLTEFTGPAGFGTAAATAGDLDGDGLPDVVVSRQNPSRLLGFLGHRGMIGAPYCDAVTNSTGQAAQLITSGSDVVAQQNLRVTLQRLPLSTVAMLLASERTGLTVAPGGSQGTLCLKVPIARFVTTARSASPLGTVAWDVDLLDIPGAGPVVVGQTWNFQAWYRDANPGATSNFTGASSVLFR